MIHVEKDNPEIRGLYPFICQQFLLHEFSDALLVNREDDIGLEGLRKSKLSYNPIYLEENTKSDKNKTVLDDKISGKKYRILRHLKS